ncbi:MAG TPA: hypothetical protein VFY45_18460 [Baekduia sp.]|nr:hypothetical protein [Baekduia sp.]
MRDQLLMAERLGVEATTINNTNRSDWDAIEEALADDEIDLLLPNVPLLATTATVNDRVVEDIRSQLGPDLTILRGSLARDSLHLQVVELPSQGRAAGLAGRDGHRRAGLLRRCRNRGARGAGQDALFESQGTPG